MLLALASSQTSRIPGAKRVYASFYSRESLQFLAPVCDCLWHPRRLPGFPMPNEFTLVSTSRESPEYIAPVCYCLWHPRRLPGSTVPNDLRLVSTLPCTLHRSATVFETLADFQDQRYQTT